jgi:hypothetical protein
MNQRKPEDQGKRPIPIVPRTMGFLLSEKQKSFMEIKVRVYG